MKKILSVLLIAAALFGFYGGAVSLKDVLAAREYWEEQSEQAASDLNKLKDGLDQLADGREDYFDDLDSYEDGKEDIEEGEEDYADGLDTLAEAESEYASAPAKLASARAQLAAGETALAEGEEALEALSTLIKGISQIVDGYSSWQSGYKQLRDGRTGAIENPMDTSALQQVLTVYYTKAGDAAAGKALSSLQSAGESLAQQDASSFTNSQYEGFRDYLEKTKTALDDTNTFLGNTRKTLSNIADGYSEALGNIQAAATDFSAKAAAAQAAAEDYKAAEETLKKAKAAYEADPTQENLAAYKAAETAAKEKNSAVQTAKDSYEKAEDTLQRKLDAAQELVTDSSRASEVAAIRLAAAAFISDSDTRTQVTNALTSIGTGLRLSDYGSDTAALAEALNTYCTAAGTVAAALSEIAAGIEDIQNNILATGRTKAEQWLSGYAVLTGSSTTGMQKKIVKGVAAIIGGIQSSGSKVFIDGLNKAASAYGFKATEFTPAASSKLAADMASNTALESFYQDMNKVSAALRKLLPSLKKKASAGKKTLAAGRKALAAGRAAYAEGLASYKSAPAKLAEGHEALEEGLDKLIEGRGGLAALKERIAEYESDEEEIRAGLAALMQTEPAESLKSILERRNGDDDFDQADGTLDTDEGLAAVETGRAYQSEYEALITKETDARTAGTAAVLIACIFAIIAAILSFKRKYKAAGLFALITAAAGIFGAYYGTEAGFSYTQAAGGTSASTPWMAAAILGAVAALHALANLTARKSVRA